MFYNVSISKSGSTKAKFNNLAYYGILVKTEKSAGEAIDLLLTHFNTHYLSSTVLREKNKEIKAVLDQAGILEDNYLQKKVQLKLEKSLKKAIFFYMLNSNYFGFNTMKHYTMVLRRESSDFDSLLTESDYVFSNKSENLLHLGLTKYMFKLKVETTNKIIKEFKELILRNEPLTHVGEIEDINKSLDRLLKDFSQFNSFYKDFFVQFTSN